MAANLKTRLYCSAAAIAMVCAGSVKAQAQEMETVVVTGQRAAIESAIRIKEKADVIIDSVSAEDVGKLPDNSITEVLQRVPGVNIARIQVGSGSENYMGEGTGISIRGLTSTVSLINGRDSFSAANGRNLAWEDVPPELAQGVDVYKSLNAGLPEGGFGGVVNLRTRQPFDFDGFTANATLTGNYADNSKKGHIGGVGLISDRWQTGIGEIGLLLNVAYSDLNTMADGVQVLPYAPAVYNPTYTAANTTQLPSLSDAGSKEVYIPGGIGFTRRNDDRVRLGLYAAAQWRPNEKLLMFATALRSRYTMNSLSHQMFLGAGVVAVPLPGGTNTFDANNNLLSTTGLGSFMWGFSGVGLPNAGTWGYEPIPYQISTTTNHAVNTTTDFSVGGEWHPSDNLGVNFALQYVDSTATTDDNAATFYAFIAGYNMSLSPYGSATLPKLTMSSSSIDLTNTANYGWLATMPHKMDNRGKEWAAYADALYTVSDTGLLRSIRGGVKLTLREENDNETNWNYRALSPYYNSAPFYHLSNDPSWGEKVDLSGLFNGVTGLPSVMYFPTAKAAQSVQTLQTLYDSSAGFEAADLAVFKPGTLAKLSESSLTGYAYANFAKDDFVVPFNGNFGVRVVAYRDHSTGYHMSPDISSSSLDPTGGYAITATPTPVFVAGGYTRTDVLPSFNIQFLPTEQMHVRFAFSQGVNRPTFGQLNPRGSVYGSYIGTYISYFGGNWGDPNLKPEKAEQFDASVEYYFPGGGMAHFAAFYKNIHNFISTRQATVPTTFSAAINSGSVAGSSYCHAVSASTASCSVNASIVENFNEKETATVDGFEVGLQKYASFLPDPFDGLGIDVNYTRIHSSQPGAAAFDMKGVAITGLPLTGLSKNTFNAAVMYDKGPLSLRLAYNWRDDFLVSTAAWQTAGTYSYTNLFNYQGQQGIVTHFALPVYQYPSGTLDANLTYNLTDDVSWTLEASNLTREITRLYMGEGAHRTNRSWYQADTRYTSQIRVKF